MSDPAGGIVIERVTFSNGFLSMRECALTLCFATWASAAEDAPTAIGATSNPPPSRQRNQPVCACALSAMPLLRSLLGLLSVTLQICRPYGPWLFS
ncbi:MAG: hypothetical protein ACP5MD_08405, partial [Verrucomicrobiia bacterium]